MPTPPVPSRVQRPTDRRGAMSQGISDWQLRHADLARTSRDTYLPKSLVPGLRSRVDAVLMGAPASAVVSHATAAALWGWQIPLVPPDGTVHVTLPRHARVRTRADRRIHCASVPAAETRTIHGLTVTSASRTWLDLAPVIPPGALLALSDQMLAQGFPADEFPNIVRRGAGRRGIANARRVIPCADARAGSPMESVLRWLLHDAGLPRPVLQYVVRDHRGHFLGRVDLAWPEHGVIVEFDGEVHRERQVFVSDLRRQNEIVLAGWRILRFTSADVLGRPRSVLSSVSGALGLN